MSLSIIATPIGNFDDITLRAIQALKEAEVIIGEEFRPMTTLLKYLDIPKPQLERLNEHSKEDDLTELLSLCKEKKVALISDCGTPGFCDPGADLVHLCRKNNITVTPLPGASSLMSLLAVCGQRLDQFNFRGFLPAKKEFRQKAIKDVCASKEAQIIMDTPYRMGKLLSELSEKAPKRMAFIGLNMTSPDEKYLEGELSFLKDKLSNQKAEFVLLLNKTP